MKKIKTVLFCLIVSFILSLPIAAVGVSNSNYHGTYTDTSSDIPFILVRSDDVVLNKVLYDSYYRSAVEPTSALMQINQFVVRYSAHIRFSSLESAGVVIRNESLYVQGSYSPTNERITISGHDYDLD